MRNNPEHTSAKRIAIVTMGVKLGDETKGYTRFRKICEMLAAAGFEVELITSSFQHWEKEQRDCSKACYQGLPYKIVFIEEPGYRKNLDLARIRSHRIAAKNLKAHFDRIDQMARMDRMDRAGGAGRMEATPDASAAESGETAASQTGSGTYGYDLVYAEIPPNDVARVCAEYADSRGIPFVADVNDLWPEAMRMVADIPFLSRIAFHPFIRDARIVYRLLTAAVGTSAEYAARPEKDRSTPYLREIVYVGNDLTAFDAGARKHRAGIVKPAGEFWISYAGTLGASYDIETLIEAAHLLEKARELRSELPTLSLEEHPGTEDPPNDPPSPKEQAPPLKLRVKILGDGPDRKRLEGLARALEAPVDFMGYQDYENMAAYLTASDILVNSLVKNAAQSIVTKIGDYLAAAKPLINTGSSREFCKKVTDDGFGINVEAENADILAEAIEELAGDAELRKLMGSKARKIAETEFDQVQSYQKILALVERLNAL